MQHLEACLLIAEADSVLCHLVMFFTVLRGPGSEVWNRVYMIAPVKKFGRVRLSTNFLQNKCGGEWKSDEFLLVFFSSVQTSRKAFKKFVNGIFGHQEASCTCMNGSWVTSLFVIRHLGKFSYL